jgi:hypothetical protein
MDLRRRRFLAGAAAALVDLAAGPGNAADAVGRGLYAGARVAPDGAASLAVFSLAGETVATAALPGRGHDLAVAPDGGAIVAFARRPGSWALVVEAATGRVVASLAAGAGRAFVGHGAFSADGRTLYTAEEEIVGGAGVVAVRSVAANYAVIAELCTGGIGPHDMARLPDGGLVVANGGIPADPATREDRVDRATMRSDLVVFGPDGAVRRRLSLDHDLRLSSLRHLSVAPDGTIAFGCQWQGAAGDGPALVGVVGGDGRARLLDLDEALNARFDNYIGSVAFADGGRLVVATSPRGGVAGVFDVVGGRLVALRPVADVCGCAPLDEAHFVLTSGVAGVRVAGIAGAATRIGAGSLDGYAWDNHLRRL